MQKETQSGRTRAYNYIRDEVLPDANAHGTFLTEDEVASRIGGISRTPVREAFLLLGAEGLLELVPRHGAYVPPVKLQEIEEAIELREMIETKAIESVIAKGRVPLAAMTEALAQQKGCTGAGLEREFNEWDVEFHLALVRASGNSLMTKVYADLRTRQIRIGFKSLWATEGRQAAVIAEHEVIIEALASGKARRAIAALQGHLENTRAGLMER